jgi:hypothetical protein
VFIPVSHCTSVPDGPAYCLRATGDAAEDAATGKHLGTRLLQQRQRPTPVLRVGRNHEFRVRVVNQDPFGDELVLALNGEVEGVYPLGGRDTNDSIRRQMTVSS